MPGREIHNMTKPLYRIGISLAFVLALCVNAYAWKESKHHTTLDVPAEVRVDKTKSIPVSISVITPEGDKYNGQIELAPGFASFAGMKQGDSLLIVDVVNGKASAELLLGDNEQPGIPLRISAFMGDEILAGAEIKLVHPEYITLDTAEVCVPADGKTRPVVQATIKDQYRRPISDVDVDVNLQDSFAKIKHYNGQTDEDGRIAFELEGRATEGYSMGQFVTKHLATPQFRIAYTASSAAATPLRTLVAKYGGTVVWDSSKRSADVSVRGQKIRIRAGDELAYVNGKPFTLTSAAHVKGGRIEVPSSFVACVLGVSM